MLRNSLQIAFGGLVALNLSACTNVKPLIVDETGDMPLKNLHIKADPYLEYKFLGVLQRLLSNYLPDNCQHNVTIELQEHTSSAIYTQKDIAKEQIRITAHIDVYDSAYNHIGSKMLDAYSTYEACDEMPHSVASAKLQARDTVIQELAQASALAIKAIIFMKEKSSGRPILSSSHKKTMIFKNGAP